MTDFKGNKISLGDKVAFILKNNYGSVENCHLQEGVVIAIDDRLGILRSCDVEYEQCDGSIVEYHNALSQDIIKIHTEDNYGK